MEKINKANKQWPEWEKFKADNDLDNNQVAILLGYKSQNTMICGTRYRSGKLQESFIEAWNNDKDFSKIKG